MLHLFLFGTEIESNKSNRTFVQKDKAYLIQRDYKTFILLKDFNFKYKSLAHAQVKLHLKCERKIECCIKKTHKPKLKVIFNLKNNMSCSLKKSIFVNTKFDLKDYHCDIAVRPLLCLVSISSHFTSVLNVLPIRHFIIA